MRKPKLPNTTIIRLNKEQRKRIRDINRFEVKHKKNWRIIVDMVRPDVVIVGIIDKKSFTKMREITKESFSNGTMSRYNWDSEFSILEKLK